MAGELITHPCSCEKRREAMRLQDLVWSHHYQGWVFPNEPTRTMTNRTYEAVYFERKDERHLNHAGEPYVHTECVWCGGTLPGCYDDQADGGSEG